MSGLSGDDVRRFKTLISDKLGLSLECTKYEQLEEVLHGRMRETGCAAFTSYMQHLMAQDVCSSEMRTLAKNLTVGETYFFRHKAHFQALMEAVLPAYSRRRNSSQSLRILSAGCSSGEEAYSLAAIFHDSLQFSSWNVDILGIDVNAASIERAKCGRYSTWSLRDTPTELKDRFFKKEGSDYLLHESIRNKARFEERNLMIEDPLFWAPHAFDIIFCCNVLMYFSTENIKKVVSQMARALTPEGFLFLGPAETLRGISQDFHLRHTHETFYYRKRNSKDVDLAIVPQRENVFQPVNIPPPLDFDPDLSWVDVICRSSERIKKLDQLAAKNYPQPALRAVAEGGVSSSHFSRAQEFFVQERYDDAIQELRTRPVSEEVNSDAYLLQAILLTNRGEISEAEKICESLLNLDEFSAGAHYIKALCYEYTNNQSAAVEQNQTAVYLDPTFAMPHLHLGLLAKKSGDRKVAQMELKSAADLLASEDASKILLFGGGFSREALIRLCHAEMAVEKN